MKLVLLVFIVLCNDFKVGSEESAEKCYKIIGGPSVENECCNQKPIPTPCSTVKCLYDTECVLHHVPSNTSNFSLLPRCEPRCPLVKEKDNPKCIPVIDGHTRCPACFFEDTYKFENPCRERFGCKPGQECMLIDVKCKWTPCFPVRECRPFCPPEEVCPNNCFSYMDSNGCKKCHCCNACVKKVCPQGTECVLHRGGEPRIAECMRLKK